MEAFFAVVSNVWTTSREALSLSFCSQAVLILNTEPLISLIIDRMVDLVSKLMVSGLVLVLGFLLEGI